MSERNDDLKSNPPTQHATEQSPTLETKPKTLKSPPPKIGLIGAGGITEQHLTAYREAGYEVAAICDIDLARAQKRRDDFYPQAHATTDLQDLLQNENLQVLDIATHPPERPPLIEAALRHGKHVLSQKPFVLDLGEGRRLADLADQLNLKLAINQNGRWAPHVAAMRSAVDQGLLGDVTGVHIGVHWNHDWCAGTPFDEVHHLILYDFAIHWFDMMHCYMQDQPATKTYASLTRATGQTAKPPLLGQALVQFDQAQATLVFDGYTTVGSLDTTVVVGTKGMLHSAGPNLNEQTLHLTTIAKTNEDGSTETATSQVPLEGSWFPGGFHGTMAELLSAIEEDRQPSHSARNNLKSLATCFAALRSADTGEPQTPGQVTSITPP